MSHLLRLLNKAVVFRFYRDQAGLFLVWFGLAFGVLTIQEHRLLASFFTSHPGLIAAPLLFWTLYTAYTVRYAIRLMRSPEYQKIGDTVLTFSLPSQQKALTFTLIKLLAPISLYGLFMILVGVMEAEQWWSVLLIPGLALLHWFGMRVWRWAIANPDAGKLRLARPKQARPTWQWPLLALRHVQPWLFAGTKSFTLIFLWGALSYTQHENIDIRGYGLTYWVITLAHLPLITFWHAYYQERLGWLYNLPISWPIRALHWGLAVLLLFLPEAILGLRLGTQDLSFWEASQTVLFGFSAITGLFFWSYRWPTDLGQRMGKLFMLLIGGVLIIMYQVPLLLLTGFSLLLALYAARGKFTLRNI